MSIPHEKTEWEFPHLKHALLFPKGQGQGRPVILPDGQEKGEDFWSVKFYPYTEPDVPPVFAVVGEHRILICRPSSMVGDGKEVSKLEVLRFIRDEEDDVDNFACAWTKDPLTGSPLLCVAGSSGKIKILDVFEGKCLRTLIGHGGPINDLAICPRNPSILASGSDDCTVRIWSLDPAHAKQPCAALLEGYGHTDTVQTLSFHANGRYLLSAGIDRMINLWTLPVFTEANTGKSKPLRIYYPHFSTSEIHTAIVDCVMWHGDLIFSKADSEGCIALWSIDNFDSSLPTPESIDAPAIPVPLRDTRSAFSPVNSDSLGYTSHLKLDIPKATYMFTRFSIFPGSKTHNPILSFLNSASQIFFWDLTRFREYYDVIDKFPGASTNKSDSQTSSQASEFGTRKHPFLQPFQHRIHRGPGRPPLMRDSPAESTNGSNASEIYEPGGTGKVDWARGREQWKKKYDLCDAHTLVEPHHTVTVKDCTVLGRQMAWSRDGKWCVAVGSWGQMALLGRWDGRVAGT